MKLREAQEAAVDVLYSRDRAIALGQVGSGKTAIALTLMRDMLAEGVVKRWLVLAPKRVATEVWPVEKEKWAPNVTLAVGAGGAGRRDLAIGGPAQIVVLNYDVVQRLPADALQSFDAVMFDELTRLKSPSGKRFKALEKLIAHINFRYGLTGSFTSNGLEDIFGQCRIVDMTVLGKTKGAFMQQYFVLLNRDYGLWAPRPKAFSQVMTRVKPLVYMLENKEYIDSLPPLHIVEVGVKADLAAYNEMKKNYTLDDITAVTAGVLTQKLTQLSSGFLYTEDGARWYSYHKFERLDEILEENQHAPTLVFYNFIEELDELKRRYPHVQTLDDDDAVARFNAGKIELLAAHPKSAAHGLNLQGSSCHMVFLSLPWSFEVFEQAVGRLHRGGQKHAVWCYLIMTEKTIDYRIREALNTKRSIAEICVDEIKNPVS